jgi:hypothetical protein
VVRRNRFDADSKASAASLPSSASPSQITLTCRAVLLPAAATSMQPQKVMNGWGPWLGKKLLAHRTSKIKKGKTLDGLWVYDWCKEPRTQSSLTTPFTGLPWWTMVWSFFGTSFWCFLSKAGVHK